MPGTKRALWRAVLALGIVFVAGCASPPPAAGPLRLGAAFNGREVRLEAGQTLEIVLDGNITTGYDWAVDALPSQLTTVSDEYKTDPNAGTSVGAGGTHTFVMKAAASGTGVLRLDYARSFEPGVQPADTFSVTVVVP